MLLTNIRFDGSSQSKMANISMFIEKKKAVFSISKSSREIKHEIEYEIEYEFPLLSLSLEHLRNLRENKIGF